MIGTQRISKGELKKLIDEVFSDKKDWQNVGVIVVMEESGKGSRKEVIMLERNITEL